MNYCSEHRKTYLYNTTCYQKKTLQVLINTLKFNSMKNIDNRKKLFTFLSKVFDDTSGLSWPVTLENANLTELANLCYTDLKPMISSSNYKGWLNPEDRYNIPKLEDE